MSDTLRVTGDVGEKNGNDNEVALQHLAQKTGGGYIDRDNLRQLLERMIQDMTTYYVASYAPAIQEFDGSFRPVAVKPLRKGLSIHTRTGYLALPPDAVFGIPSESPFK